MFEAQLRWLALLALITVVACNSEADFDERYTKTEKDIRLRARAIDSQLDQQLREPQLNSVPDGQSASEDSDTSDSTASTSATEILSWPP